jgi:hypothetical protein
MAERGFGTPDAVKTPAKSEGGAIMAKPLLPDELWQRIEPLLPAPKPRRFR